MTVYWVDQNGKFLRATDDKSEVDGATKVTTPPNSGRDTWNGSSWDAAPPPPREVSDLEARIALLEDAGSGRPSPEAIAAKKASMDGTTR